MGNSPRTGFGHASLGAPSADAAPVGSTQASTLLDSARSAWRMGHYPQSLKSFEELADLPGATEAQALPLIQAELSLGRIDRALDRLRKLKPKTPGGQLLAALAAYRSADQALFADVLHQALLASPDHPYLRSLARFAGIRGLGQAASPIEALLTECNHYAQSLCPPGSFSAFPRDVLLTAIRNADRTLPAVECGVFRGMSLNIIAERWSNEVHGFDSFEGLPEAWTVRESAGAYSTEGELPDVRQNVKLHVGWFEDTLPKFLAHHNVDQVGLLHIDCDIYSSTKTTLECLDAALQPGTVIVFDDFLGFPEYRDHEMRAWNEFVEHTGLSVRPLSFSLIAREASFVITSR